MKRDRKVRNPVTHEYHVEYGYEDDSQEEQEFQKDKKKVKISYKQRRQKDGHVESQMESVIES